MYLLAQASPCPAPHSWLGGVVFSKLTWGELVMGSPQSRADTLLIALPIVLCVAFLLVVLRALRNAGDGVSTAETIVGVTPCADGGVTSVRRANGNGSVFGEGNPAGNLLAFCVGQDGVRWDGVMAVPSAHKPAPQPHPLVVPQGRGEGRSSKKSGQR